MRFDDIPAPTLQFRVRATSGIPLSEQPVLAVSLVTEHHDEYDLRLGESILRVSAVRDVENRQLTDFCASGRAYLAHLLNVAADGSADLQMKVFIGEQIEMGSIDIGAEEPAIDAVRRLVGDRRMDEAAAMRDMGERARYSDGTNDYFFLTAGEAAREDLEEAATSRAFALHGNGMRMAVREQVRPDDRETIFFASKVTRPREIDAAVRLAHGGLRFLNWTAAGALGVITRAQLSGLLKDESGYMKTWDAFGALEGELFLERARAVGGIRIIDHQETRAGVLELLVEPLTVEQLKAVELEDELEFVTTLPLYLTDLDLDWEEFSSNISGKVDVSKGQRRRDSRSTTARLIDVSRDRIALEADDRPRGEWLILPVAGEVAQIRRRMQARASIVAGRSANPSLALLIEEKGKLPPRRLPLQKSGRLSAMVQNKVFKESPTKTQRDAIDIALNTPDIALIQGPPGTGKTTVIAAIVEQLNALADKRKKNIRGQILLTGFQHDAVENLIARLTPNSLPVPKFGSRWGQGRDEGATHERDLEHWCLNVAEQLRASTPELSISADEENIRNLCIQYIKAPTSNLALNLLNVAMALPLHVLGEDLSRRLKQEAEILELERQAAASAADLQVARSLRVRPESFADDGPATAYSVKEALRRFLTPAQVALLAKAAGWTSMNAPDFMTELNDLKRELLTTLTPPPAFRVEKARDAVVNLADETMRAILQRGTSISDRKVAALHEFLTELETNPRGCVDSLTDLSFAFAATVQQSVNSTMQDAKGVAGGGDSLVYDYVIVDEAGRVGPRDLMIPMAQGKKIVLVGDHRQLPHMVEKAVADKLEAGEESGDRTEWFTKSMFEYLFSERLPALQAQDGIPRTVTLNTQYRMHPVLGEFVSSNFYEIHDSSESFDSGRDEGEFSHSLPGTDGKCAAWIDVRGRQARSSTGSLINRAEAAAIATKLTEWMTSEEGKHLKFGAISFYRAQADLIQRNLSGKVDPDRLLVGTVDSFQGREFDVVFLSAVKTAGGFGFLELYNRLNVAMSRQEKLLVAVGDSRFFDTPDANEKVPGLHNFLHLCRDKGVML